MIKLTDEEKEMFMAMGVATLSTILTISAIVFLLCLFYKAIVIAI